MTIRIDVYRNRIIIHHRGESSEFVSLKPFTTTRLLIGDYLAARECLIRGFKDMGIRRYFYPFVLMRPDIHFYPKEMCEGGFSPVEIRTFEELGFTLRASNVEIIF